MKQATNDCCHIAGTSTEIGTLCGLLNKQYRCKEISWQRYLELSLHREMSEYLAQVYVISTVGLPFLQLPVKYGFITIKTPINRYFQLCQK